MFWVYFESRSRSGKRRTAATKSITRTRSDFNVIYLKSIILSFSIRHRISSFISRTTLYKIVNYALGIISKATSKYRLPFFFLTNGIYMDVLAYACKIIITIDAITLDYILPDKSEKLTRIGHGKRLILCSLTFTCA